MVLFPIALIWVAAVLIYFIRRSQAEPNSPESPPRRFRPRCGPGEPATPRPAGSRPRRREAASRRTER